MFALCLLYFSSTFWHILPLGWWVHTYVILIQRSLRTCIWRQPSVWRGKVSESNLTWVKLLPLRSVSPLANYLTFLGFTFFICKLKMYKPQRVLMGIKWGMYECPYQGVGIFCFCRQACEFNISTCPVHWRMGEDLQLPCSRGDVTLPSFIFMKARFPKSCSSVSTLRDLYHLAEWSAEA